MTVRRISLVAWHAFGEYGRDRAVYGVGAFLLLLVLFGATALVAGPLSAGEGVKIVKDLGLALVELSGGLMAVVIGVGQITRETDRRSILSLLAKPLPRWEFVVGKYAGLVMTIVSSVALMGTALFVVLAFTGGADARLSVALVMIAGELALLAAVALFFSVFSSSALVSVVLTVGVFVAGQLSADLRSFGSIADVPIWVASAMALVGWALPDFSSFDVKAAIVHGEPLARGVVPLTLLYGALYATGLVAGAVAVFSRREFR
jgi:ABC-type transport system involved in multi-copper enzyme maturation permease subunit